MIRAIQGAVKNAADAHPEYHIDGRFARSVAKRATGTLTAQWSEVLAARQMPSDWPDDAPSHRRQPSASKLLEKPRRRAPIPGTRRSPLRRVWKELSWRIGEAKRAGLQERAAALIEMIKVVAAISAEFDS